ncbi:polysaccharide deacetylase family protein [Pseudoalteromonas sp. MSK9-3]|uniref:polysaccharide deacetylase family protein n=1 Tax=Pseudoalteromonas sp. MSK9-3 TaxID=1897633 RepID=UPI0016039B74|nr:polysaccharide deacetylase family protein [Pseudoalteromonas sp. MSK9-3]
MFFLCFLGLLTGCNNGNNSQEVLVEVAEVIESTASESVQLPTPTPLPVPPPVTPPTSEVSMSKIVSAQGSPDAQLLSFDDFDNAQLACVDIESVIAATIYLENTTNSLEESELRVRVCSVVSLYNVVNKADLTPELLIESGVEGFVDDTGKPDLWAFDEVMLDAPEKNFLVPGLQKLVNAFHYNRDNVWPKQINISFDDGGALDSLYEHLWRFEKYNATITYFVSHLALIDEQRVLEIEAQGHEIGHHGALHRHAAIYSKEHGVEKWLEEDILGQLEYMKALGLNVTTFAYPFGARTKQTDEALLKHFTHVRRFAAWSGLEYRNQRSDLAIMTGFSIDSHRINLEQIFKAMDTLRGGETLYLGTHAIGNYLSPWHITTENLEAVIAYAASKDIQFCKMAECQNFKIASE